MPFSNRRLFLPKRILYIMVCCSVPSFLTNMAAWYAIVYHRVERIQHRHSSGSLPDTWPSRVSARTEWPGIRILWRGEIASFISSLFLSVSARTTALANQPSRYIIMLLGCYSFARVYRSRPEYTLRTACSRRYIAPVHPQGTLWQTLHSLSIPTTHPVADTTQP